MLWIYDALIPSLWLSNCLQFYVKICHEFELKSIIKMASTTKKPKSFQSICLSISQQFNCSFHRSFFLACSWKSCKNSKNPKLNKHEVKKTERKNQIQNTTTNKMEFSYSFSGIIQLKIPREISTIGIRRNRSKKNLKSTSEAASKDRWWKGRKIQ